MVLPPSSLDRLATSVLLFSATLWGLTWLPLKWFIDQGLSGPVVSLMAYGTVGLATLGMVWKDRKVWLPQWHLLIALVVIGGWANTSFVNALMLGDVVRVMFLFYLSPVWSVLGGRWFLKEHIPPARWVAVVAAIVGLWMVLDGPGFGNQGWTALQPSLSDLLALSAGLAFAANNIIARAADQIPMRSKTFAVFAGSGLISALAVLGLGHSLVEFINPGVWLALLAYGFGWLLLATATWQFGVSHLESSRAGIILLVELVVSVLTALWFGEATLSPMGWIGGTLITLAALVEAIDSRIKTSTATPSTSADMHM